MPSAWQRFWRKNLAVEGLNELFCDLEMPLVEVLADLEFQGIKVDVARLHELSDRFGVRIRDLKREIFRQVGAEFNIDSRPQLSDVLFNQLGLPVVKRTKTGPSTDADVLSELAKQHPLPATIVEYRQYAKLKSTYVDALAELVPPRHFASSHLLQTRRGRYGSVEFGRSKLAEHSDPHGRGA